MAIIKIKLVVNGEEREAENTEVTEVESNEEAPVVEETPVVEEESTEEFSAEESNEAIAQAVEKFEEEREELTKTFNAEKADLEHALAELGEEVKSLKAELEAKQVELDALNAKPTEIEGNEDANITGEEAKLSSNQEALIEFYKSIKG